MAIARVPGKPITRNPKKRPPVAAQITAFDSINVTFGGATSTVKGLGHDARLMPAKYVRPYSKGQKNDFRDAEAIARQYSVQP
jgi:hypothetical protein